MVTCFSIRARFLSCAQLAHLCFVPCHHAAVTPLLPLMAIFFATLTGFSAPIKTRQTPRVLASRTYQRTQCFYVVCPSKRLDSSNRAKRTDGWTDGRRSTACSIRYGAVALRSMGPALEQALQFLSAVAGDWTTREREEKGSKGRWAVTVTPHSLHTPCRACQMPCDARRTRVTDGRTGNDERTMM
ncbi:uncharacterized protein J3D65DRAFT_217461 [Phyllosticta citribraziliensis]|uniref:Secreted protein n=1 Tax=Phyllosticta citribraziliensis TaxID=989973 RepID=A0ABR1M4F6_9PEZI